MTIASGLNSRGLIVTFHTPNDRAKHEQCTSLSRDISQLKPERTEQINKVYELESRIHDTTVRLEQIKPELQDIGFQEMANLVPTSRVARAIGEVVSSVLTGAQAFGLARRRDELERERDSLRSQLSNLNPKLQDAKRRLENVDRSLSQLQDAYSQLGCGLAFFTPSN